MASTVYGMVDRMATAVLLSKDQLYNDQFLNSQLDLSIELQPRKSNADPEKVESDSLADLYPVEFPHTHQHSLVRVASWATLEQRVVSTRLQRWDLDNNRFASLGPTQ